MVIWLLFALILIIVSVNDFLFFRIENEYVFTLICLYIIACIFGISGTNFISVAITTVGVFIVCILLNHFDLLGGGDTKLLIPLLLFSEHYLYEFTIGTAIGGLILAVIYRTFEQPIFSIRKKILRKLHDSYKNHKKSLLLRFVLLSFSKVTKRSLMLGDFKPQGIKQEIPYGIALSCGGLYVVIESFVVR